MGAISVHAERGLEESALILIATWHRQGTAVTQQFNMNHGHPDGDLVTSILAYLWFIECRKTHSSRPDDAAAMEWRGMREGRFDPSCVSCNS